MLQRSGVFTAPSQAGKVIGQIGAAAHARRIRRLPDAWAERTTQTSNAHASDLNYLRVERAAGGARIALGRDKVRPHLRATVVVVVAKDPMNANTAIQERGGQRIQWPIALHVAQQNGGARQFFQRIQTALYLLPLLMDVADKDNRHKCLDPCWP